MGKQLQDALSGQVELIAVPKSRCQVKFVCKSFVCTRSKAMMKTIYANKGFNRDSFFVSR
jgi:hypothetical protein